MSESIIRCTHGTMYDSVFPDPVWSDHTTHFTSFTLHTYTCCALKRIHKYKHTDIHTYTKTNSNSVYYEIMNGRVHVAFMFPLTYLRMHINK